MLVCVGRLAAALLLLYLLAGLPACVCALACLRACLLACLPVFLVLHPPLARAQTYNNIVRKSPLFPLSSLMTHGVIHARMAWDLNLPYQGGSLTCACGRGQCLRKHYQYFFSLLCACDMCLCVRYVLVRACACVLSACCGLCVRSCLCV